MRLFLAEKPSMGRELANCLAGPKHVRDGYIETAEGIVTWAYGHILTQWMPEDYDEKYRRWRAEDLPIVPQEWRLQPAKGATKQFRLVARLLKEADEIVHAGDPDREGQLLVDEILEYVGNTRPVRRILLNALDEASIRAALADLRDNRDFRPLRDSALARSRADWLMGLNLSRAYTLRARRGGHVRAVFPVGRVKTPTLALVVRREREIRDFVPREYFLLKVRLAAEAGEFVARWQPREEQTGLDSEGRLIRREVGEDILARCEAAGTGIVSQVERRRKQEPPPLPLSLSALQVLAGKRYGYAPQQVLEAAQQLYERKYTTYPRSDCEYLPENQHAAAGRILANLAQAGSEELTAGAADADASLRSRAWNDAKITAHHAIIPTTVLCPTASLTPLQRHIYELIARAYIAQFYPNYQYEQTKLQVTLADELFTAGGRVDLAAGWKALYRKDAADEETKEKETDEVGGSLPKVRKGAKVAYRGGEAVAKTTKAPSRFTPSTLLDAMKKIHRYVADEKLKKQLREVAGIGTEATRATIIQELVSRKFMRETGKKKYLTPTEQAEVLIDMLPDALTYPDETAKWEERLAQMSAGEDSLRAFLEDQEDYVRALVAMANDDIGRGAAPARRTAKGTAVGTCPRCGKSLVLREGKFGAFYGCTGYPACRYTAEAQGGRNASGASSAPAAGGTAAIAPGTAGDYPCVRCGEGHFVWTGARWQCSRYPACHTVSADADGRPAASIGRRKG